MHNAGHCDGPDRGARPDPVQNRVGRLDDGHRQFRVAVIGDIGGHVGELRRELRRLGASRSGRLPDDLIVIQVGDLVHNGPNSDAVVRYVNRRLSRQPDHWIQLIGNHETHYLREPVFRWGELISRHARATMRRWWRERRVWAAVAVTTADEDFLVTHAGVTEQFWRETLGAPGTASEAADRINTLARSGDPAVYQAGRLLGGGPPNPHAGPIWADRNTELVPGWKSTPLPFSQIHGHSGSHGPSDDPDVAYDPARHHEAARLDGGRIIGVDPGHRVDARHEWQAFVVTTPVPPRIRHQTKRTGS